MCLIHSRSPAKTGNAEPRVCENRLMCFTLSCCPQETVSELFRLLLGWPGELAGQERPLQELHPVRRSEMEVITEMKNEDDKGTVNGDLRSVRRKRLD